MEPQQVEFGPGGTLGNPSREVPPTTQWLVLFGNPFISIRWMDQIVKYQELAISSKTTDFASHQHTLLLRQAESPRIHQQFPGSLPFEVIPDARCGKFTMAYGSSGRFCATSMWWRQRRRKCHKVGSIGRLAGLGRGRGFINQYQSWPTDISQRQTSAW